MVQIVKNTAPRKRIAKCKALAAEFGEWVTWQGLYAEAQDMGIAWAVTHITPDGRRVMTLRKFIGNTSPNRFTVEAAAKNFNAEPSERIAPRYGAQAVGTFAASRIMCERQSDGLLSRPIQVLD